VFGKGCLESQHKDR